MRKKSTKVQNPQHMCESAGSYHHEKLHMTILKCNCIIVLPHNALLNYKLIPLPSHLSAQNIGA